mmetsp:Transcript_5565/g.12188  ORF Transcript_5565/g.12188 Transcript_5565/m.12188 type:complete len:90 (-) Transcript_5565:1425-1694(-)
MAVAEEYYRDGDDGDVPIDREVQFNHLIMSLLQTHCVILRKCMLQNELPKIRMHFTWTGASKRRKRHLTEHFNALRARDHCVFYVIYRT